MEKFKPKRLIYPIELYELLKHGHFILNRDKIKSSATDKEYLVLRIRNVNKDLRVEAEDKEGNYYEFWGVNFRDMIFSTTERLGVHVVPYEEQP